MKKIFIVGFILALSLILRLHNYYLYPQRGATSDEYTYSFLGVSLLTKGMPISWSYFDYKNKKDLNIKNIYFPIVYPYFDHPPLNGLLIGSWAVLNGQNTFEKIELKTVRLVPIFLGMISSLLVFLIANRLYSFGSAIFSLLIFSTTTLFVMNMRVVVAENLLTVLWLSAVYLYVRYVDKMNTKRAVILGIICGLAFLTKILGIGVFLSILYLLIYDRIKRNKIYVFCGTFFIFCLLLLSYAWYYDWNLFWHIQFSQSGRSIGPETLRLVLQDPVIVNKVFYDGWYFFGFFSLFLSFNELKKNKHIIVPSFVYLCLLLLSMTKEGHSGWYLIPFFPFMSIAMGQVLRSPIGTGSFLFAVFLLFIGVSHIQNIYQAWFGLSPLYYRVVFSMLVIPFLIVFLTKRKWILVLAQLLFYIIIIGNILQTYFYVHPA